MLDIIKWAIQDLIIFLEIPKEAKHPNPSLTPLGAMHQEEQ